MFFFSIVALRDWGCFSQVSKLSFIEMKPMHFVQRNHLIAQHETLSSTLPNYTMRCISLYSEKCVYECIETFLQRELAKQSGDSHCICASDVCC